MRSIINLLFLILSGVISEACSAEILISECKDIIDDYDPMSYLKKHNADIGSPSLYWEALMKYNPELKKLHKLSVENNSDFRNAAREFTSIMEDYTKYFNDLKENTDTIWQSYVDSISSDMGFKQIFPFVSVSVIDCEEDNAFTTPDGMIFLTSSLIKKIHDEQMIACVIAHEVVHFVLQHSLNCAVKYHEKIRKSIRNEKITKAIAAALILSSGVYAAVQGYDASGDVNKSLGGINRPIDIENIETMASGFRFKYGRMQEFESDIVAARYMDLFGNNPGVYGEMLKKLDEIKQTRFKGVKNNVTEILSNAMSADEQEKSTHPTLQDRMKLIRILYSSDNR